MEQNTILPLGDTDEADSMSLTDIYNMLLASSEIILTIPAEDEERLRKGLASVKAKSNKKMQAEGLLVDKGVISYSTTPAKNAEGEPIPGAVSVLITLGNRGTIRVFEVKLPDDSI